MAVGLVELLMHTRKYLARYDKRFKCKLLAITLEIHVISAGIVNKFFIWSLKMKKKAKWTTKAKCLRNIMQGAIARGDTVRVDELKNRINKELESQINQST